MQEAVLTGFPYGFIEEDWFRFRDRCFRDAIREPYERLVGGLDAVSVATAEMYLARLKRIPFRPGDCRAVCDAEALLAADMTAWDREQLAGIRNFDHLAAYRQLNVPERIPNVIPVSYYHNGLKMLLKDELRHLAGRDFIDGGAYCGESAFFFADYGPRGVYSFEPEPEQFARLEENFSLALRPELFHPVPCGLGERDDSGVICGGDAGATVNADLQSGTGTAITLRCIDSFAEEHQLDIGCIKLDIEGMELEAIRGAAQTIRRSRPVLLVSIYHTVKDFFGVKAWLESEIGGYRFLIRHLDAREMLLEYMLIGIPESEN